MNARREGDSRLHARSRRARGGALVAGPKNMGPDARYAVIKDPAGAVAGLYQALK